MFLSVDISLDLLELKVRLLKNLIPIKIIVRFFQMWTEEFDDLNVFSIDCQEYYFLSAFNSPFERNVESCFAKFIPLRNYRIFSDKSWKFTLNSVKTQCRDNTKFHTSEKFPGPRWEQKNLPSFVVVICPMIVKTWSQFLENIYTSEFG